MKEKPLSEKRKELFKTTLELLERDIIDIEDFMEEIIKQDAEVVKKLKEELIDFSDYMTLDVRDAQEIIEKIFGEFDSPLSLEQIGEKGEHTSEDTSKGCGFYRKDGYSRWCSESELCPKCEEKND